jgi:hypothetical protein
VRYAVAPLMRVTAYIVASGWFEAKVAMDEVNRATDDGSGMRIAVR